MSYFIELISAVKFWTGMSLGALLMMVYCWLTWSCEECVKRSQKTGGKDGK